MKTIIFLFLLSFICSTISYSQFDILKKVKEKVEEKIEQKTDEKIDEGLQKVADDIENPQSANQEKEPAPKHIESDSNKPAATGDDKPLKAFSKYDFIPGSQVFYYDDFSSDEIGDFPARWNTNNMGDVVSLNNYPGKWFRMNLGGTFYPEIEKSFPDNFTLEFDLIFSYTNINDVTSVNMDFYSAIPGENMDGYVPGEGGFRLGMGGWNLQAFNWKESQYGDIDMSQDNNYFEKKNNQLVKVSVSVQGQRVRMFLDENKIFDIPRLAPKNIVINRLRFYQFGTESENFNFYISNLRIAFGSPDTRNKFLTEGKFVTRGIYFDSGSDKIKPQSYPTLKEIAAMLNENPSVKVKIVGHTDSDGADQMNLDLSKRRANAVKTLLSSEFSVAAERMEFDGKGESEPVSDNNSAEGKANNRRVEFIKI
jgi:OmpA-OmpF porin, OOP family